MLSGRSTGVAVTLRRCCQELRPEIAISAGQTSNHEAAGEPYRYRYCSPLRQNLGLGSIELSKSLRRNLTAAQVVFWKDVDSSDCIQSLTSRLSLVVTRSYPRDASLAQ